MEWFQCWINKLECKQKNQNWSFNNHLSVNQMMSNINLYQPMQYMMDLPAKRIRPLLCILAYISEKNIENDEESSLLELALSIEWLHNFTLAHDDIMDHAEKRRGKNALHVEYNQTTAILAGDALFAYAFLKLSQAFPDKTHVIAPIFARIALEICEGQAEDIALAFEENAKIEHYLEMIRKKTAVLLGCALEIGSIAAGTKHSSEWYKIGEKIGLAFQLMDDYLDVFGESSETGKISGGDILENKKTGLWLYAFEQANSAQKEKLLYWRENQGELKVLEVSQIFRATQADTFVLNVANELANEAESLLQNLSCSGEGKNQLLELFTLLRNRQK